MQFTEFTNHFSVSRINRYYLAVDKSENRTIELYKANLYVSKSFHPFIGIFEVIIRNKLDAILSEHFNDTNWIINQKSGFMIDKSLTFRNKKSSKLVINRFLLKEIVKAENKLTKGGLAISSGKIIAEQTLGFWTELFEVHNYRLLKGKPIKIFKSLPTGFGRKEVNEKLIKIRKFRNRINHNEPVCFAGNTINFDDARLVYRSIIDLLKFIEPKILDIIFDVDEVITNIEMAENV